MCELIHVWVIIKNIGYNQKCKINTVLSIKWEYFDIATFMTQNFVGLLTVQLIIVCLLAFFRNQILWRKLRT